MAQPGASANPIRCLSTVRETWRICVGVLRIWERCPVSEPCKPYAILMVLVDAEVLNVFNVYIFNCNVCCFSMDGNVK